jgi:hypothetical protein
VSDATPPANGSESLSFSTTNTQEQGVDEADRIEFDGATMFVAEYPVWFEDTGYQSAVRVLQRQSDNQLVEITELSIAEPEWGIQGMYLSQLDGSHLAVISGSQPVYPVDAFTSSFAPEFLDTDFVVDIYDTTDPQAIGSAQTLRIDGRLLSSRRINNDLYLVNAYVPRVEGLVVGAADDASQLENYRTLQALDDQALLPTVTLDGQVISQLTTADCYVPEQATAQDGFSQLIHVVKFDLASPGQIEELCLSAVSSFTYASTDALYISGTVENDTFLHKVGLGESFGYQASGTVSGIVGWSAAPQLRLSEYEDTLRIVTKDYLTEDQQPLHRLFTVQQQADQLVTVGQLPNEAYPEPLGKPGEDVYAVRYVGHRAYVVTFERIDPLYVIDNSEPAQPQMLGALEIPGVSNYLQPISSQYLLGIGQQIQADQIPANGQVVIDPLPVQQMKISLFDVSDPQQPLELSTLVKEHSYTPAEYDYRALSVLSSDNNSRFAMPVEGWRSVNGSDTPYHNSLLLIDVETNSDGAQMSEVMQWFVPSDESYYVYAGEDRSVITTEGVYYLRGNQLWFHSTLVGDEPIGPF